MLQAVCVGLFLPLLGFLILMSSSFKINRSLASLIGCTTVFISFICFTGCLISYLLTNMTPQQYLLFNWIPIQALKTDFSLYLDPLSILMTLIITGIGFLIHVYSIGYMDHDNDFARFFACLNFFIFAMLLLVLAANLLVLFVGWEGVGLASYLLIGFWYQRPSAAKAATKAFVINRIGDLGLLLGILLTFYLFGTSDIAEVSQKAKTQFAVGAPIITLLTCLYFWGATGKSAQIPLYTWLPDAMEGPTPVSALIHAATMVTAGVYLVVRMHALFLLAPFTLQIVGYIGAITALLAALCALGQTDLKRVLAYSTVSQIGYMFLACGAGAFYAAMFHLTTHAFVKALLFLSAGNVVHMMNGETKMEKMGGLAKIFNRTNWLFLIGVLALSGIPPLAAFFSKDLILEQEHLAGFDFLFLIGLITSILTAFYLMRAYNLTFLGNFAFKDKIIKIVNEAPQMMLIPVSILAFLSIVGGFLGYTFNGTSFLQRFLAKSDVLLPYEETTNLFFVPETWIAIAGSLIGLLAALYIYKKAENRTKKPISIFNKAFYINEIYWSLIGAPLQGLASFIANRFEPKIIEGSINSMAEVTQDVAGWIQQIQSGQIRSYIAWMVAGMAFLIVYFIL